MQLDNMLIVVIVFAVIFLLVILAYRRRIKTAVKALGAEFSIEAESRSEPVKSAPSAAEPNPPPGRTTKAIGEKAVAVGGSAKGANIATGNNNTVGNEQRLKR